MPSGWVLTWLCHPNAQMEYMEFSELQGEVTPRMRSILIDWMIEVQVNFSLVQETLYLAVNILNRFISLVPIARDRLQLVGAAALLVASKHEEVRTPTCTPPAG